MVADKFKLRTREVDFFIGCVLGFHDHVDIGSRNFIEYMKNVYPFTNDPRQIYNFRSILVKKKWLKPTGDTYDIPPLFKGDINSLNISVLVQSKN